MSIARWILVTSLATLASCAVTTLAVADSVTIEAVKDNTLFEDPGGALSNGEGDYLFTGRTAQGGAIERRRALVAFDVAAHVPAGAIITGATLRLFVSRQVSGPRTVSAHRLLTDFGEGSSIAGGQQGGGAPRSSGDATWLHAVFPGSFWSSQGGDFTAAASASQVVNALGPYEWTSAGMVTDVQSMLDQPESDFGWVLIGDESQSTTAKRFNSRESSPPDNRPRLVVDYDIAAPVPGVGPVALLWSALAVLIVARLSSRRNERLAPAAARRNRPG